jgi:hypothetical protein
MRDNKILGTVLNSMLLVILLALIVMPISSVGILGIRGGSDVLSSQDTQLQDESVETEMDATEDFEDLEETLETSTPETEEYR